MRNQLTQKISRRFWLALLGVFLGNVALGTMGAAIAFQFSFAQSWPSASLGAVVAWIGFSFSLLVLVIALWAANAKSERTRLGSELEAYREKLKLALESSSSGFWDWDLRTNEVYLSRNWKTMLGYDEDEIPGSFSSWERLVHPEDLDRARSALKAYLEGRSPEYELEHRLLTKAGAYRWVLTKGACLRDAAGTALRMAGWHIDIHPMRERDQKLAEQEATFSMITSHLGDVIWLTDAEKGNMIYVSPSYEKVWERSRESLYENTLSFVAAIHDEDRGRVIGAFDRQTDGVYNEVYRIVTPSGAVKWIRDRAFPIKDASGKLTHVVGIATDITLQRLQEQTIQEQQARLASSARLSSLGEMAGGLAHEINNPLAVIQAKAEQIGRRLEGGELDIAYVRASALKIQETSQRIVKIIKGLRTLSRNAENDPLEKARLPALVEDALELCRESYKHHDVELRLLGIADVEVNCRPSQIGQVLLNLLNNAQDAAGRTEGRWVEIAATVKEEKVELSVKDSGGNIPDEVATRMMQPFFTTKEVGKGTGLGLSISLGLARSHGGNLFLDRSGDHTRMVLELPINAGA